MSKRFLVKERKTFFNLKPLRREALTQTGGSVQLGSTVKLPPYTKKLLMWSFSIAIIPPIVLIAALSTKSLYLLDYIHVICGGTWTGFDLYTGLVLTRIMRSLDLPA